MFEPGIGGLITLKLHNVTLVQALDAVREAYGYDYRRMDGGFVIVPPTIQISFYQVNYLDLERRGTSRTRVTSGEVSQAWGQSGQPGVNAPYAGNGGAGVISGGAAGGPNGPGTGDRAGDLAGSTIATRSQSDFWKELGESLKVLVGEKDGRQVVVNAQSGVVAVRATPSEQRAVRDYLTRIQDSMTRQVVLEAKIIEVDLSNGLQTGINWAAVARSGSQTYFAGQTVPQQGFNGNLLQQPQGTQRVGPGNPVTSLMTNTLGGAFTFAIDAANFNAFIQALGTQGHTRVLSSPRVSTLNNQKAVIKSGSDEFFVTNVYSSTVVGTSSATSSNVELTPFFSGIALDVTPQVAEDGVILHIHPTVSTVTEKDKLLTISNQTNNLPLAFSEVRESDSVVRAHSGQIVVIGGLMSSSRTTQDYRVPGLGDLPLIGNLFKSQQRTQAVSELVILLRPIVIGNDARWDDLVDEPLARARRLDPESVPDVK